MCDFFAFFLGSFSHSGDTGMCHYQLLVGEHKKEKEVWRKGEERREGPLGNAFKTDQTRLKGT